MGIAAALLAGGAQASKVTLTGKDFLTACSRPDPEWISFCHGYVQAVVDGVRHPDRQHCVPAGYTRAKLVGLVTDQLHAIPDLQKNNAASVVFAVLVNAFPCR